jgi:hypothetical protein
VIRRLISIAMLTGLVSLGLATNAGAGVYTVAACRDDSGVNHAWRHSAWNGAVESFTQCPAGPVNGASNAGLTARNSLGAGAAPAYSLAETYFDAPTGTRIVRVWGEYNLTSQGGWGAGLVDRSTNTWKLCGTSCLSTFGWRFFDLGFSTGSVAARVICGRASGCDRSQRSGSISLRNVHVILQEDGAPSVSIVGGSLVSGGWRRGRQEVAVRALDPIGIASVDLRMDGVPWRHEQSPCDSTYAIPCPSRQTALQLDTAALADGPHGLSVEAADSAGNRSRTSRTVYIDNHAPTRPTNLSVDGGTGWKAQNQFKLRWRNPPQNAAPISAVKVELCNLRSSTSCGDTSATGTGISSSAVRVAGAGEWRARLWVADAAGNVGPESYAETILRLDNQPPTLVLQQPTIDRPAVVNVKASDQSGLAAREIIVRRRGTTTWLASPVKIERDGFSTRIDDEALAKGVYEVRARAVDLAGNERSTDRRADNKPLVLVLPLRIRTRLTVGRPTRVHARGAHGRHHYRIKLVRRPRARFGHTIRLRGRLTSPGGNPLADREVRVFEQTNVPGAAWREIATLQTNAKGRFTFRALRGPSRTLRFRYGGSDTIRGRTAEVRLGVRAATSMRASRSRVVNGDDVTFRGQLRGAPRPSPGKLVELQARTRGGWRTFATTRANQRTGRWLYRYRFSATRGSVRYRFRARVPKESSYPYETGVSRSVVVGVRGL